MDCVGHGADVGQVFELDRLGWVPGTGPLGAAEDSSEEGKEMGLGTLPDLDVLEDAVLHALALGELRADDPLVKGTRVDGI